MCHAPCKISVRKQLAVKAPPAVQPRQHCFSLHLQEHIISLLSFLACSFLDIRCKAGHRRHHEKVLLNPYLCLILIFLHLLSY